MLTPRARSEAIHSEILAKPKEPKPRAKRGSLRVNRGLARAGLQDVLAAFALALRQKKVPESEDQAAPAVDFGLESGDQELTRLLQVYKHLGSKVDDARLHARIAEAMRVYVRDERLSRVHNPKQVTELVQLTIDGFDHAFGALTDHPTPDALRAWVLAHRAAAYSMQFFLTLPGAPDDEWFAKQIAKARDLKKLAQFQQECSECKVSTGIDPFQEAKKNLEAAIAEYEQLPSTNPQGLIWTRRFLAFLYALRGLPASRERVESDFTLAREQLERVRTPVSGEQTALSRSMAMLFSFDAVDRADDEGIERRTMSEALKSSQTRREAIAGCIEAADAALAHDPEDFVASYFSTVGNWLASLHTSPGSSYQVDVAPSIESARIRSCNAISQANATLLGLDVLEAMQAQLCGDMKVSQEKVRSARDRINKMLNDPDHILDLETQAVFFRDPVWFTLANDNQFEDLENQLWQLRKLRCRIARSTAV